MSHGPTPKKKRSTHKHTSPTQKHRGSLTISWTPVKRKEKKSCTYLRRTYRIHRLPISKKKKTSLIRPLVSQQIHSQFFSLIRVNESSPHPPFRPLNAPPLKPLYNLSSLELYQYQYHYLPNPFGSTSWPRGQTPTFEKEKAEIKTVRTSHPSDFTI